MRDAPMASTAEPTVAVVVGAAGGIGAAVVRRLLDRGVRVAGVDLAPATIGVGDRSDEALHAFEADVCDARRLRATAETIASTVGPPTILVNCAGAFSRTSALAPDADAVRRVVDVNLIGAIHCTEVFGGFMARVGEGRIVHVASIAAETGAAAASVYAASKAAVVALARSHARELAGRGIAVNAVLPGYVRTPMVARETTLLERFVLPRVPLKRLAEPDEIAEVIEMLALCRTPFLTGAAIPVDGGLHVG